MERITRNKHILLLASFCFLTQTISCSTIKKLTRTREEPIRCAVDGIELKSLHFKKFNNVLAGQVLTYRNCLINVEEEYEVETKYNRALIASIPIIAGLLNWPYSDSSTPGSVEDEEAVRQRRTSLFYF